MEIDLPGLQGTVFFAKEVSFFLIKIWAFGKHVARKKISWYFEWSRLCLCSI